MAKDLPYLPSYKNVATLFERISKAKIPDALTVRVLGDTIGLKSTGDRQLIGLLKKLGFLDNSGKPTPKYNLLKNSATAKSAIADGIRQAYSPLYAANENAHSLPSDQLKGLIAQVSGAEEGMTRLIHGTFNALAKAADFSAVPNLDSEDDELDHEFELQDAEIPPPNLGKHFLPSKFSPEFRFNIEIHLPSNGTEETYLAIFNALRRDL
jgi:Family of unknown function (DUF5343)